MLIKQALGTIIYDNRRFSIYSAEVDARNYQRLRVFTIAGILLGILDTIAQLLQSGAISYLHATTMMLIYFIILHLIVRFAITPQTKHIRLIFYAMEFPLMALAILLGTFYNAGDMTVAFMVFLCALPIFILDYPWRILLYISCSAAAFAICCAFAKDPLVFRDDMINLVSYWLVAMGVNLVSLGDRIESVEACERFRVKSERDLLTGIYNRGSGDERISQLLSEKASGAFIIIDIDNFKQINDTYGHAVGDAALVSLSQCILRNFRADDIAMRMGGDEFVVFAVGLTDRAKCRAKLQQLQQSVGQIQFDDAPNLKMTVSIGCTISCNGFSDYMSLYKHCDACLYMAKGAGKNRIVFS